MNWVFYLFVDTMETFNQLLDDMGKQEWPELLEKLQGNEAQPFVDSILRYLEASETARNLEYSYYEDKLNQTQAENAEHREQIRQAQWRHYGCHRDLCILIDGKMAYADTLMHIKHHPYDDDEV